MKEMWKGVEDYKGLYQVSDNRQVRSLNYRRSGKVKVLRQGVNSTGYLTVGLCSNVKQKTHSVHRLVAKAFIPNPDNKPEVNHKDGNKTNNHVDNLEWVTRSENILHAYDVGLKLGYKPENSGTPKKPVIQLTLDGDLVGKYESACEAARQTGIDYSTISKYCSGKRKTAGKYKWRYASAS